MKEQIMKEFREEIGVLQGVIFDPEYYKQVEDFLQSALERMENQHRKFQKAMAEDVTTACTEARIEECHNSRMKSTQEECAWFKEKPTAWRTVWETIGEHSIRLSNRISTLRKEVKDGTDDKRTRSYMDSN